MGKEIIDSEKELNERIVVKSIGATLYVQDKKTKTTIKEFDITRDVQAENFTKGYKTALLNGLDNAETDASPFGGIVSLLSQRKDEINELWTEAIEARNMDAWDKYKKLYAAYCDVLIDFTKQKAN